MDDPGGPAPDRHSSAKRLGRRATLKLIGLSITGVATRAAAPAAPAQGSQRRRRTSTAPSSPRGRAWRYRPLAAGPEPHTFTPDEIATLGAAVGLILPDTDTPGAKTAGVHWYLDDAAQSEPALRDRLRAGCRRLDEHARAAHGRPFAALAEAQQVAILEQFDTGGTGTARIDEAARPQVTGAAAATSAVTPDDRSFFATLKTQTIDAYYKSEMGQLGELEWVGHEFNDEFPGRCTHTDPQAHPRPKWPRVRG